MNDQKTDRDWATRITDAIGHAFRGCSREEQVQQIEDILDERDAAIIRGFREKGLLDRHDN